MRLHCRTMSANAMCRNSHDCPGLSAGIHFQLCACTPAGVISDQPVIWLMLLSKCCYPTSLFSFTGSLPTLEPEYNKYACLESNSSKAQYSAGCLVHHRLS